MTVRLAIVGAGANIWSFHHRAIQAAGLSVVAVHDVVPERAAAVGAELGCPATDSLDELLAVDCDAVSILAPHRFHHELVRAALSAGRHVLVEKPITVSVEEARDLCAAARDTDRVLAVCFQQRTRTEVVRARELVRSGALGELQRVDLLGVWPRRTSYFHTAPWRATWVGEGGGILINQGQHDLDVLCFVAGMPSRVSGFTRTAVHPIETEDTAAALLQWPGGALGAVHLTSAEHDTTQRIELTGTGGRLRVTPGRLEFSRNDTDFRDFAVSEGDPYAPPTATDAPVFTGSGGRHEDIYANFREVLTSGATPVADAVSAAATLELAAAIMVSAHDQSIVDLPLADGRHNSLLGEMTRSAARAGADN